ncbi:MAG: hypothetical protein KAJ56_00500 [Candidatus Aenigmarchaeota archaeon]|nr:hypothetical protein [Candidatus Aenigmarchaeota archaeon]
MPFDGTIDAVDMPVIECIYEQISATVQKLFEDSDLSGKYNLVGFNLNLDLNKKRNLDSSKKKLQKCSASFSQFRESVIGFSEIYDLNVQILHVYENDRKLLEGKLGTGEIISDSYNAKELKIVMGRDSFELEKDYIGFYLEGGITDNRTVLIVYRLEPSAVLVNTTMADKINAEQILVEFF